jgi:hypothetical protein
MAMMAMTTSSSISVKAARRLGPVATGSGRLRWECSQRFIAGSAIFMTAQNRKQAVSVFSREKTAAFQLSLAGHRVHVQAVLSF